MYGNVSHFFQMSRTGTSNKIRGNFFPLECYRSPLYSIPIFPFFNISFFNMRYVGDEEFAKRVISYYVNVAKRSKIKTVKHFQNEGKDKDAL